MSTVEFTRAGRKYRLVSAPNHHHFEQWIEDRFGRKYWREVPAKGRMKRLRADLANYYKVNKAVLNNGQNQDTIMTPESNNTSLGTRLKSRIVTACFGETFITEYGENTHLMMRISDTECYEVKIEPITVHQFETMKKYWQKIYDR